MVIETQERKRFLLNGNGPYTIDKTQCEDFPIRVGKQKAEATATSAFQFSGAQLLSF